MEGLGVLIFVVVHRRLRRYPSEETVSGPRPRGIRNLSKVEENICMTMSDDDNDDDDKNEHA